MTALFTSPDAIRDFIVSASDTSRSVYIPSISIPGSGGRTGEAPGDSNSLS